MKNIDIENHDAPYTVDIEGYTAAADEGAVECHFTLDGREVPANGSDQ